MVNFIKEFCLEVKDTLKPIYKYLRFFIIILLFLLSSSFKLIPIYLFNIDPNNVSNAILCLLTLFSNCILLILCILFYFKELKEHFKKLRKMKKERLMIILDTSFRYWLIGLIIMIVSNFIIGKLGIASSSNDTSVRVMLEASPLIAGLSVIFIAPFIEEVIFRMAFKNVLNKKWLFILTSGIIFGSLHVIFSINSGYELLYLIPYCSLGLSFAVIYQYSDNIFISYLIHLVHNGLTAITTFLLAGAILW